MTDRPQRIVHYLLAAAATALALLLHLALQRTVGAMPPYFTFYPAIILVALFTGMGPGLLATILAALAADYWVLSPRGFLAGKSLSDTVALGFFAVFGALLSAVAELYRRARDRAAQYQKTIAVRESDARFRTLFEHAPDAVFLTAPDGRISAANPVACAMFGRSEEEICQVGRAGLLDGDDPRLAAALEERQRTGHARAELTGIRKTGERFAVESSSQILDSAERQSFVILRDITERRRVEEDRNRLMEESQLNAHRLRWALQAGHGGGWDWDLLSGQAWWSPEMYPLWGVPPGTPMHTENSLAIIDVRDRQRVRQTIADSVARRSALHYEFRIQHSTGGERWMETFSRTIYDSADRPVRMLGITLDITERKQVEESLRKSQEQNQLLADVIEQASQPFTVSYPDGRLGLCNKAYEQLTGYSAEELRRMNWMESLTPPEWLPAQHAVLESVRRTGQPERFQKE